MIFKVPSSRNGSKIYRKILSFYEKTESNSVTVIGAPIWMGGCAVECATMGTASWGGQWLGLQIVYTQAGEGGRSKYLPHSTLQAFYLEQ